MSQYYDVIIVGAGPAGIFAALELCDAGLRVLLLEKGADLSRRVCPAGLRGGACASCRPCNLVSGFGGAGAFSDGKLTLSPDVGGWLSDLVGRSALESLIAHVDAAYVRFGAPAHVHGTGPAVAEFQGRAALAGLRLIPSKVRHLGCENCRVVLDAMHDHLESCVDIKTGIMVREIVVDGGVVVGVVTESGERYDCRFLVCAPGREGSEWLEKVARANNLGLTSNAVDVGCRVEVAAPVLKELTSALYEAKLEYYSSRFDDRVRTFCMCPEGEVVMESTGGDDPVITVNGVGYAERRTPNTNFAVLVSTSFTEPFHQPIAYGKYLARLANLLSGGVLVQRLGDLRQGRRSTDSRIQRGLVKPTLGSATPGDLSFALPYRYLADIVEMLEALDRLAPGVASSHTLLYGVEVKFYSSRLKLSASLETEIPGLFAVGDGAGVTRGLVQASVSGVVAGRAIASRVQQGSGS